ncbi:hypothetical protein [Scytonema sp. NUACC26]|uniref:hypothetical protein n=1 Tax=Scytonema sp. NUACC26 TaxID=3140176 RepID=UPI0034DBE450
MTDEELKQLIASNAKAIQAATDERVELRLAVGRLEENIGRIDRAIEQLTTLNQGIVRLLASLDDDRPTILRRLMSIENKVDQLLDQKQE